MIVSSESEGAERRAEKRRRKTVRVHRWDLLCRLSLLHGLREMYRMPLKHRNLEYSDHWFLFTVDGKSSLEVLCLLCSWTALVSGLHHQRRSVTESRKTQSRCLEWDNGSFKWINEIWRGLWRCNVELRK